MLRLLLLAAVGLGLAGCDDKVPTQAGPKSVQVQTTGGTATTP